jgi:hypothetical protein
MSKAAMVSKVCAALSADESDRATAIALHAQSLSRVSERDAFIAGRRMMSKRG